MEADLKRRILKITFPCASKVFYVLEIEHEVHMNCEEIAR